MKILNPNPKQPDNVLSHWYAIVDGIHFSSNEFYESVIRKLDEHKVPRLKMSRVEYHEGGILSDKRVYLRLAYERSAFEICAAPFGVNYFFSVRFVEVPRRSPLGAILWLLLGCVVVWFLWKDFFEPISYLLSHDYPDQNMYFLKNLWGRYWWLTIPLGLFYGRRLIRHFMAMSEQPSWHAQTASPKTSLLPPITKPKLWEMPDFDTIFLSMPIIGPWYEERRKNTYHRHDSKLLYHSIVSEVVKSRVNELTAEKGVKLLRTFDYDPILGELYKPTQVTPQPAPAAPPSPKQEQVHSVFEPEPPTS